MVYFKRIAIGLLALIGLFVIFLTFTSGEQITFNVEPAFEYSGLLDVKNGQYNRFRENIPLKDGNKIAVTYFVPLNKSTDKVPTILVYSPYTSSIAVPEMPLFKRIFSKYLIGQWGPVYDKIKIKTLQTLTSNGYAIVLADMRGTGSSTGYSGPLDPIFIKDAAEILDWIAAQSWSNAKVGMLGQSYQGWSQFAAASSKSPYLKCIAPEMIFYNLYEEGIRPGGIYAQEWNSEYSAGTIELNNKNLWNTSHDIPSFPSEPVIDEDGDGKNYDDIPILKENDLTSFSEKLSYEDGNERPSSPYIALTKEHQNNIWPQEVASKAQYLNSSFDFFGREVLLTESSIDFLINNIKETKISILLTGGFYDGFSGIPQSFINLQKTNPAYLFMAPRFHLPAEIPAQYKTLFDYSYSYGDQLMSMQLQFFDHYLKDIDNGFDSRPPSMIYTAFEGWKQYETWPPKEAEAIKFQLGLNHTLKKETNTDTTYAYNVDFTHSSSYNAKKSNPTLMYIFNDSLMLRNEHDEKCIVFETAPLKQELTFTGYPIAHISISCNQDNADVYLYLSDVDTSGNVLYVTEGKLRAGWHKLYDNDESLGYTSNIEPDLPWHSYRDENYDMAPFKGDSLLNLTIALKPHAWKFKEGHKIRLSIAGADNVNYEFNPTLSPDNKIESCKPTTFFIHTGTRNPSYLELPIIH